MAKHFEIIGVNGQRSLLTVDIHVERKRDLTAEAIRQGVFPVGAKVYKYRELSVVEFQLLEKAATEG